MCSILNISICIEFCMQHILMCIKSHSQQAKANIFTVHNEVAKVMFLHLSVSHSVHKEGGSASVHAGIPTPLGADPPRSRHSPKDQAPPPGPDHPPGTDTPPSRWLLLQTVRILLECILVSDVCCLFFDLFGFRLV